MTLNFNFSQTGTSRFAQVIGSGEAKFLVGKETVCGQTILDPYNLSTRNGPARMRRKNAGPSPFWTQGH